MIFGKLRYIFRMREIVIRQSIKSCALVVRRVAKPREYDSLGVAIEPEQAWTEKHRLSSSSVKVIFDTRWNTPRENGKMEIDRFFYSILRVILDIARAIFGFIYSERASGCYWIRGDFSHTRTLFSSSMHDGSTRPINKFKQFFYW